MCAAAISFARLRRLYFGAADPKGGAVEHGPRFFAQATCHHRPEVYRRHRRAARGRSCCAHSFRRGAEDGRRIDRA